MDSAEKRALAALWSLQGIGPKTLASVRERLGPPGELLERPVGDWAHAVDWVAQARVSLGAVSTLAEVADRLERNLRRLAYQAVFPGEAPFPERLVGIPQEPPLLFMLGPGAAAPPRRRVAMVGTRHPESGFEARARKLARQVAQAGLGVVSGAAYGVDQVCHLGALDVRGETWAFLGCAIEQMDPPQERLRPLFRAGGGTLFSEFPPGTRSDRSTFSRRNRLISGAADAVVVLRAPYPSGALKTARYAREQGRPVLALPGDHDLTTAIGCNRLIQEGLATVCLGVDDITAAVGAPKFTPVETEARVSPALEGLSALALEVLRLLDRQPKDFDVLLAESKNAASGGLAGALMELELAGHVFQRPGRRYEKVA